MQTENSKREQDLNKNFQRLFNSLRTFRKVRKRYKNLFKKDNVLVKKIEDYRNVKNKIRSIVDEVENLIELHKDLGDLCALRYKSKENVNFSRNDMNEIIKDSIQECTCHYNNGKRITVHWRSSESLFLKVDKQKMKKALVNVLFYIIKNSEQEKIPIKILANNNRSKLNLNFSYLCLDHKNQKIRKLNRLLETERDRLNSEEIKSLGLDLYIARRIIRIHNGKISIKKGEKHSEWWISIYLPHRNNSN